ncbi:hypothetical protein GCM10009122_50550 [Fulvivirga kasyanovii]|uniref:RHS repeat-associated core domain-containing protein n=1 Tax=Fulvivirga kasyanovii TaxID=396812 RepID=A0ABW9RS34_9BACT|nr:hypothetical protein [Fulvivirga kasyanovii]MTI25800.1 hypothetical protein [Fulvivirga kasyanovii]
MFRKRKLIKAVAIFFTLQILFDVIYPTISYALTAGPTAPEATSFEPVDTTDMVNLATGDFVYNIPLLEVPGPSGGYPLSLSYHAGIQPNEEASWVGLGWTLNPGAINRNVSGYADDYSNITQIDRTFWEGGETTTRTFGVSYGVANGPSVSAGLSVSEDTYQGFGVGGYAGASVGARFGGNFSAGVNVGVGISPYGDKYSSMGIGLSIGTSSGGANANASVGLSINNGTDFNVGASGGIGYGQTDPKTGRVRGGSLMGATLSSNSKFSSTLGGGAIGVHNSKQWNMSTRSKGFDVEIPTVVFPGLNVRLARKYTRYWIDETAEVFSNGALYMPPVEFTNDQLQNTAFDVYDLAVVKDQEVTKPNFEDAMGGAFIDYDNYNVLGQGVSGSIRPYYYNAYLYRQNKEDNEGVVKLKTYPLGPNKRASFRFENDFSNRFEYDTDTHDFSVDVTSSSDPLNYSYDDEEVLTGNEESKGYILNKLAGSKNVDWFTNRQIYSGEVQVIGDHALGFTRNNDDQIGAIRVTNESGVVFHYSLPVYSYDEYVYSGSVDNKGKESFNQLAKKEKYAYSWFLTAVTGPDYIDRGIIGELDEEDWGYWVSFDYGRWTKWYGWRNPAEGFNKDLDQKWSNFSKGKKELYYLNSIRTKTHTAIFVKELRADSKGVTSSKSEAVLVNNKEVVYRDEGGFEKLKGTKIIGTKPVEYDIHPISTLKLNNIYLFNNEDVPDNLESFGSNYQQIEEVPGYVYFEGNNVLDVEDIQHIEGDLKEKSLRSISFDHDYSLAPYTSNSFYSDLDALAAGKVFTDYLGKLTLNSVRFLGKSASDIIPPVNFDYDIKTPVKGSSIIRMEGQYGYGETYYSDIPNSQLEVGDILHFGTGCKYALVESISNERHYLKPIKPVIDGLRSNYCDIYNLHSDGDVVEWQTTKNPPYNKNHYDLWGFYKSDIKDLGNENLTRITSETSSKSVDVWSLRSVNTSLGAKVGIEYESDEYSNSIKKLQNLIIKDVQCYNEPNGILKLEFYSNIENIELTSETVKAIAMVGRQKGYATWDEDYRLECENGARLDHVYIWNRQHLTDPEIIDKGKNYLLVRDNLNFCARINRSGLKCVSRALDIDDDINCTQTFVDQSWGTYSTYDFSDPFEFIGGEISFDKSLFNPKGGGLRVKSISLTTDAYSSKTMYDYEGGVTSYEPVHMGDPIKRIDANEYPCLKEKEGEMISDYVNQVTATSALQRFYNLFSNARELPGPGVFYSNVKVSEEYNGHKIPGYSVFNFETFETDLVTISGLGGADIILGDWGDSGGYNEPPGKLYNKSLNGLFTEEIKKHMTVIRNSSSRLGELKSIVLFDENGQKVTETINHYLHDKENYEEMLRDTYGNQGLIEESFVDARQIIKENGNYDLISTLGRRITFPSLQTGQTNVNYKTGVKTTSKHLAFDFFSGAITKILTSDSYGNCYVSESTPAYKKYDKMGLAVYGGKNMLAQEAANYNYQVTSETDLTPESLISASVQTWSNSTEVLGAIATEQENIWRKQSSYIWRGDDKAIISDDLYPYSSFFPYRFENWTGNTPNSSLWKKNSEITLFDPYSHALEVKDLNGNYAATKMDIYQERVYSTVANARYNEYGYTGFEKMSNDFRFSGGIKLGVGDANLGSEANGYHVHTGSVGVKVTLDGGYACMYDFPSDVDRSKTYHLSVWVHKDHKNQLKLYAKDGTGDIKTFTGAELSEIKRAGDWYLASMDVSLLGTSGAIQFGVASSGGVGLSIDDFRFHPIDATMTSYVYNKWGELSHTLDANNIYTRYVYDGMGRLTSTYRETFDHGDALVGEVLYHYGRNYLDEEIGGFNIYSGKSGNSGNTIRDKQPPYKKGDNVYFTLSGKDGCNASPIVEYVKIDGKTFKPGYLPDGTRMVKVNDYKYGLEDLRGDHNIFVGYKDWPTAGTLLSYRCRQMESSYCNDGYVEYTIADGCGGSIPMAEEDRFFNLEYNMDLDCSNTLPFCK